MKKGIYYIIPFLLLALLFSCSTKKNTKASRFYHAFNSRYNIYFNGKTSFDESLKALQNGYKENYTERIHMFPISAQPKGKTEPGGAFDRAIEKGNKAIKLHSIKTKPPKKAGWRNQPKQVAFQNQEEYNPFLKHCWLLIGEGQFYNADFLQASATFSYIARHFKEEKEVVAEARIWQARSYAEMNWLYEADDVLNKLKKEGIPKENADQYARVMADYLIKNGQYEEAIPYLRTAIKAEKNGRQRSRQRYLLGQLYAQQGQDALAYEAFGTVPRSNPPYELEFAARIRQTEVYPKGESGKVISRLKRMAKGQKNKDYLDQLYYAIGNIYLSQSDTANAVLNYRLGIDKSTQNGMDKAICQIRLGDIYFQRQDYIHAQPCFSGALAGIQKEYKDYERISKLSAVLDELVVYAEAVHLQDSLQLVAKLPEKERLARIDSVIESVKKQEKEAEELAKKEAYLADQESRGSALQAPVNTATMPIGSSDGSFYFYNPQLVAQGKAQFQNKWGRRTLEDNWRRRKKEMSTFDDPNMPQTESPAGESSASVNEPLPADSTLAVLDSLAADPHQREYYLQQLPMTEEEIESSNLIIVDGLFNMAMIYKDKLEDLPLSIRAFDELEQRFPDNRYRLDSYYNQFLMALQLKDYPLAEQYKNRLIRTFPESDYAVAIADPNYEQNMRRMDTAQDSIYERTYSGYLAGDTTGVRRLYREFSGQYPLGTLMPKFMFLNALTYVQAGDAEGFKTALKALIDKYPDADVTGLAGEMLKGVLQGRSIVQGGITGMAWNLRFGLGSDGSLSAEDSARVFSPETEVPHRMLLIYPTGSVDKNQLLFAVAAYNFAHFQVKSFDLALEETGPVSILTISGFSSMEEIIRYYRMIYGKEGYANELDRIISIIPISDPNNETLLKGKTLEEYMNYFAAHFKTLLPEFITRQNARMEAEKEAAETEKEQAAEKPEASTVKPAETTVTKNREQQQKELPAEQTDSLPLRKPIPELTPTRVDTAPTKTDTVRIPAEMAADSIPGMVKDSVAPSPVVIPTDENQGITLKELKEMRKKEAEEAEAQVKAEAEAQKTALKTREQQLKDQADTRETLRKQKEKAQKEKLKQRKKELKEKEKARKAELREREKKRKQQLKEKEAARRQALREKQGKKVSNNP